MDIPTHAELVAKIDDFLVRHAMAPSRFGREATGEPDLVRSIREGRSPSLDTLNRLAAYMAEQDERLSAAGAEASSGNEGEISGGSTDWPIGAAAAAEAAE